MYVSLPKLAYRIDNDQSFGSSLDSVSRTCTIEAADEPPCLLPKYSKVARRFELLSFIM